MENQPKKISYLEIFKQAFLLTWKNRYLWWFGLFIALSGVLTSFNYSSENIGNKSPMSQKTLDFLTAHPSLIITGLITFVIIFILLIVIGVLGRGALIKSLGEITAGRKASFKIGMRAGKKYFWKIFLLYFAIGLFNLISLILLATPVVFLFYTKSYIIGGLLGFIAILILIPLFFITSYLKTFGSLYVVLGNLSFSHSLENSYTLLVKNLKSTIILLLLFIPINILVILVAMTLIIPIAIVFSIVGLILFLILKNAGIAITIALAGILIMLIFLILKSIYEVFAQAVWLLFFREIAKPEESEEITEPEKEIETMPEPKPIENI